MSKRANTKRVFALTQPFIHTCLADVYLFARQVNFVYHSCDTLFILCFYANILCSPFDTRASFHYSGHWQRGVRSGFFGADNGIWATSLLATLFKLYIPTDIYSMSRDIFFT